MLMSLQVDWVPLLSFKVGGGGHRKSKIFQCPAPGRGERVNIEFMANSRWLNQSCLHNEVFIKFPEHQDLEDSQAGAHIHGPEGWQTPSPLRHSSGPFWILFCPHLSVHLHLSNFLFNGLIIIYPFSEFYNHTLANSHTWGWNCRNPLFKTLYF